MTSFHVNCRRGYVSAVLLLTFTAPAFAQEPGSRAEQEARQQQQKAESVSAYRPGWLERRLLSIEHAGGFGVSRGLVASFGGIKRGSGAAFGVAYGHALSNGAAVAVKGGYSINNYKLVQVAGQSAPLAHRRLIFTGRARWQDAPAVRLYELGPDSSEFRTAYAETKTEVSGEALLTPVRILKLRGGVGLERFDTGIAHNEGPLGELLFAGMPGAGANPSYLHSQASGAIDFRDSAGYSRRGSLLSATFHDYRQSGAGPYSFQRLDGVAEQYVPILHGNWVVFLSLHASTTMTESGHEVPFFLMPDLGGHDLRGFGNYRFRDRHSINWTAEYRWYVQEFLDAAIFYDAGKTVPTRGALDFEGLKSSVGAGIRLHSAESTFLRLEVARSHEGVRFLIAFSPVGQ